VALPSGKTIEVVYFNEEARETRTRQTLHICPDCDASLVYPTQWREVDRCSWEVSLRCPNCEWHVTDVYDQDTVERFDEELDRGTDNLVDDLKRLVAANMEEEIDRFSRALANDHVLPEDF
jgi:phage-related protein